MESYMEAQARQIAQDFDHDKGVLPNSLTIEQYALWWVAVKGNEFRCEYGSLLSRC